jgi:hypothetical protein
LLPLTTRDSLSATRLKPSNALWNFKKWPAVRIGQAAGLTTFSHSQSQTSVELSWRTATMPLNT